MRRALLCLLSCLSCAATAGATRAVASVGIGVNSDITWGIPQAQVHKEIALIQRAGIGWIRVSVDLSTVDPNAPGVLSLPYLRRLDRQIRAARRANLSILMTVDRTPYWASADPHKHSDAGGRHWNDYWTYSNPQDYAGIVAALVARYSAMGVHAYQVWNEPNFTRFWPSGIDPAAYTQLLAAAYPAIKHADPAATVVSGGLSNVNVAPYLLGLYAAGANRYYDVASFHIYPAASPKVCTRRADGVPRQNTLCLLGYLRSIMLAHGDGKPAWLSEIGWSTCSSPRCVSRRAQARYLTSALRLLSTPTYSWVQVAFIYEMHERGKSSASWNGRLGLVESNFKPKPAYYALARYAHHH